MTALDTSGPPDAGLPPGWAPPSELAVDPNPGLFRTTLHWIYDAAWLIATVVGFPWLVYRATRGPAFRRMVIERLGRGLDRIPPRSRPRVLVHGVSVGEVKAALPIVRALQEEYPELEVVVSATTDTGMEVARSLFPNDLVVRFPVDPTPVVERFLARVDPALVLLVELEIWPNFLRSCNRAGRTVAVVNGRITELSHAHYLFFRDILPQFNRISLYCVQLEEYAQRFRRLDVELDRILVTGNVKVDGLRIGPVACDEELARLLAPREAQPLIVAGSTHEPEERFVVDAWREHASGARLVIVPRHPHRCEALAPELVALGVEVQRLSELRAGTVAPDPGAVTLIDTIGELERVYSLADLVFVGGSLLPHGGQNMLEPAAQGRAVLFGPHVANFAQEAALLTLRGAAEQIESERELGPAMARILADDGLRARMGEAGMDAVRSQRGATRKTVDALDRLALRRITGRGTGAAHAAAARVPD